MLAINKILLPTDFSRCSDQALAHALYLAERYRAELHITHSIVLHADDPSYAVSHYGSIDKLGEMLRESYRKRMQTALKGYNTNGVSIRLATERGVSAAPVILEYAHRKNIDLIVMGTHGRRGLGHMFLGSVAEEVVRLAPCPVFTIREEKKAIDVERFKTILVPIDFSERSRIALRHAKEIAHSYKVGLQLIHVVENREVPRHYINGEVYAYSDRLKIKALSRTAMARLFKETEGPDVSLGIHVIDGHAARDIVQFVKDYEIDLVVIATHGLTGIKHLLLGSVAEKVVRMAPCPVFTVKAYGKSLVKNDIPELNKEKQSA